MRLALAVAALLPSISLAQWHQPLDVRNHRSADLVFLRLAPRSYIAMPGGRYASLSLVVANEFQVSGPIDEDAEVFRPSATFGFDQGRGLELFFEVPLVVRGGGFMDPIIEWWHDHVVRAHDPIRAATDQGRSHIEFPGGGPYGSATGLGDVTVGFGKRLKPGLIARLAAKLPTGNPAELTGSGNLDFGGAIDWQLRLTPSLFLDLNGEFILQGKAARLDGTRPTVYGSTVALTWTMNSRDAWTVQWNTEQSPTRTGQSGLDSDHRVLSFGYQRRLDDQTVLQLYFSENGDFLSFPGGPTIGPDLTVAARIFRRT